MSSQKSDVPIFENSEQDPLEPVGKKKAFSKRQVAVIVFLGVALITSVISFILYLPFSNGFAGLPSAVLAGLLLVCLLVCIPAALWPRMAAVRAIVVSGIALASLSVSIFSLIPAIYHESITIEDGSDNYLYLDEYLPFSNSPHLARLDHEASLRFNESDDLPVLDGATALVPVYASFFEAVYPENIPLLKEGRGTSEETMFLSNGTLGYIPQNSPFRYSNTIGAYAALAQGNRDIVFGAYPSEEQISEARDNGVELEYTPIGSEGFVFFVNESNPVDSLTVEQVKGIYSGEITNWREVGGKNEPIIAYQRNADSGSQTTFKRFMEGTRIMPPSYDEAVTSMGGIVKRVAAYRNTSGAIGFSFRYYTQEMMAEYPVKLLAIDGVEPTLENIKSGEYPLSSNFYAVTLADADNPSIDRLLEWILSDEGQYLIEQTGYAPLD